ncbi:type IV pilus modification PilV family protein [Legionella jordanis]|uniref:Tfp pilus assembly protein PilV n=2 Tax=Legionella jordanis TaxID=456 RepID=A0A0W0VEB4_9GAMM|nr:prepilin-type N-terminal cleavage/methylation domain-containing protein [Legionella jordanis]KTD18467.1 hypothetical protein Ljor_2773 [Legionella jordanis]VEH13185.1 Tfp pilus assembly protein PilV [Legionella jordanis]HAT8715039.1 prepilin-type N-terminal cleavage/methylation domain-containing protein [Legionella jordanis]
MKLIQGFSFIELLLTLSIISGISLALLQQQVQIEQLLKQALYRAQASLLLDNNADRLMSGQSLSHPEKPFKLTMTKTTAEVLLNLNWGFSKQSNCCMLQRSLALD